MKILLNESLSPKPWDFLQVFRLELFQEYTIFSKDIIKIYSRDILGYSKSKTISIVFFLFQSGILQRSYRNPSGILRQILSKSFQRNHQRIYTEILPRISQENCHRICWDFFENYHNYLVQENFQKAKH